MNNRIKRFRPEDFRTTPPPKDGSTIAVPYPLVVEVFWDNSIRRWVLSHAVRIDTLDREVMRWRRPIE
jgi:hypothetical protein